MENFIFGSCLGIFIFWVCLEVKGRFEAKKAEKIYLEKEKEENFQAQLNRMCEKFFRLDGLVSEVRIKKATREETQLIKDAIERIVCEWKQRFDELEKKILKPKKESKKVA